MAIVGDCAACHTDPHHGKPFAGGYALETPFGKLLASNITSDKNTGIGAWSEQEFTRAVREGKGRHGENLYPAMPYNAYVKVSDQDMRDLWAYMQTVPAVDNEVVSNQLPFPFNIRLMMMGWNLLFFDNTPFEPVAGATGQINRGAYLVDGLGHCAACHTPKNFLGGDKGGAYLQGGELAGWHAPQITGNPYVGIGGWSDTQVVQYLKTGSNHVAVASGPMAEAVTNSTQHMHDEDLYAIAAYLKTLPGSDTRSPRPLNASDKTLQQGANVYSANCSVCHNSDGKGINQLASSLAAAFERQAQRLSAHLTLRYQRWAEGAPQQLLDALRKPRSRRHGMIVIAPDTPSVQQALNALVQGGTPTVLLTSNLTDVQGAVYVGIDNHAAGRRSR